MSEEIEPDDYDEFYFGLNCFRMSCDLYELMEDFPGEFTDADKVLFSICMDRLREVAQLKNGFSRGEEAQEGVIDVEA